MQIRSQCRIQTIHSKTHCEINPAPRPFHRLPVIFDSRLFTEDVSESFLVSGFAVIRSERLPVRALKYLLYRCEPCWGPGLPDPVILKHGQFADRLLECCRDGAFKGLIGLVTQRFWLEF